MKVLFSGQIPKDVNYPEAMEDAVKIATDAHRIAVSDGASESFDSKIWAQLLVDLFSQSSRFDWEGLVTAVQLYDKQFNPSELSWSKQAAFERGSFATLLGVEINPAGSQVSILSVGDSLAILLSGDDSVQSFPYMDSQQFQQRPELLCTKSAHNSFVESSDFDSSHSMIWDLQALTAPVLLCMTDALGEWALKMKEDGLPQWAILLSLEKIEDLERLVLTEREARRMRIDDVTLVSIALNGDYNIYELPHA